MQRLLHLASSRCIVGKLVLQRMKDISTLCISASAKKHYKSFIKLACPQITTYKYILTKFNLRITVQDNYMIRQMNWHCFFFMYSSYISIYEKMIDIIMYTGHKHSYEHSV